MSSPYDFTESSLPADAFDVDRQMTKFGLTRAEAEQAVAHARQERVFVSKWYQVNVTGIAPRHGMPAMFWLSIKRRDKAPIRDWRVLQRIKNAILTPEHEAVELFPAESRLVDTANQYHLWALASPGDRFPFGFEERLVQDGHAPESGVVQRPLEELDQ